jgi:hypothetical protein
MGLDIQFEGSGPGVDELDGMRLTNVSGFLNLTVVLGTVLNRLNQPDDEMDRGFYRAAAAYADEHGWADGRFEQYLTFLGRFAEHAKRDLRFPLSPSDYDPVARRLCAALMLRDEPVDRVEAERITGFLSLVAGYLRAMGRFRAALPGDPPGVEPAWASDVLDKYQRCVEVTAETGVGFRVSF